MHDDTHQNEVFAALAHPERRRMLDLLVLSPGSNVGEVASHFEFSRIATMKHLSTLETAGLVVSEKEGRVRKYFFNPMPIQTIYERWTDQYSSFWAGHVSAIQARAEARAQQRRKKHA